MEKCFKAKELLELGPGNTVKIDNMIIEIENNQDAYNNLSEVDKPLNRYKDSILQAV